ncbi:MAG TPA: endonuclease/exonuclease/phosphatase family protein [Pyrinomonadaceae bacterium]|jgi:endonuclease/exonuclease/phosphatase family metal-dependent hydrolase
MKTPAAKTGQPSRRACALVAASLLAGLLLLAHGRAQRPAADAQAHADAADLLETGSGARVSAPPAAPSEFKLVSYNIRWRGGAELRRLAASLRADAEIGGALVIGLQEVDRRKERTGREHCARVLADALGMHYAWAAPPAPQGEEEETGVALLSAYPLEEVTRLVLPHAGPGGRRRVALGATVRLGDTLLRVYSVHAETRVGVAQKIEQQRAVLADLERHPEARAAVVLGDFNTWEPRATDETAKLFAAAGFVSGVDNRPATFHRFLVVDLKLDWLWLRGLAPLRSGIANHLTYSDHWPLWTVVRLPPPPTRPTPCASA